MRVVSSKCKPKVAVSGCLLGQLVRYDGRAKQHPAICQLSDQFELIPLCPEVGAGLSVPRPPVQLVKRGQILRALGVEERGLDVSEPLKQYFESQRLLLETLSGIILKTKSPSCGINTTPFFNFKGQQIGITSGVFAAAIQARFPTLPLIDDEQFNNRLKRKCFLNEVNHHSQTRLK
jgi:uncharacterized protein YbbK (DUF523 family)